MINVRQYRLCFYVTDISLDDGTGSLESVRSEDEEALVDEEVQ